MIGKMQITDEARSLLGCEGIALESGFVTLDEMGQSPDPLALLAADPDSWFAACGDAIMIFVGYVDLQSGRSTPFAPQRVVKFSEHRHAIPQAEKLKLGTPNYYREYEGHADGVRDEMEASQSEDMVKFVARNLGSEHGAQLPPLEGGIHHPRMGRIDYKMSGQVISRAGGF